MTNGPASTTPSLILASSSPRRQAILKELGFVYHTEIPDIDEDEYPGEPPLAYVQRLARAKADAVARRLEEPAIVLAADTTVILAADTIGIDEEGTILGKPADADQARQMLRRLRGRDHLVCTAFCAVRTGPHPIHHEQIVQTVVTMRSYTDAEIEAYIATGDPFDKAGSYAIQHPQFRPVAHITGSHSNVVGLPADEVRDALTGLGLHPMITSQE